jgi:hypothetical protein
MIASVSTGGLGGHCGSATTSSGWQPLRSYEASTRRLHSVTERPSRISHDISDPALNDEAYVAQDDEPTLLLLEAHTVLGGESKASRQLAKMAKSS